MTCMRKAAGHNVAHIHPNPRVWTPAPAAELGSCVHAKEFFGYLWQTRTKEAAPTTVMSQSSSGGVERTDDAALAQAGEGDCVGGLGCGLEGADGGAHEGARHALARPHRQQRQAPQVVPLLAGPAAELACSSGDCASTKLSAVRLVRAERRPEMLRVAPPLCLSIGIVDPPVTDALRRVWRHSGRLCTTEGPAGFPRFPLLPQSHCLPPCCWQMPS